ncbi:type II toxin-antitoxin system VapC family toxin [Oxalobacteraceae bacterium]|nr:type II toxin-antitoxin system VapC family toxin [Oxalobacteraceae bacterium]
MRLLLDTHVLFWWLQDNHRLSTFARARIEAASEGYVSSASIWEASIKASTGKLKVNVNVLVTQILRNGFLPLGVTYAHAEQIALLPLIHRDPFDRMLIAQAICEPLTLLTADRVLADYSDLVEII